MDDLEHIFRSVYRSGKLSELGSLALPWETVVGDVIAKHCRPRRLKGGILFLSASSPAWAQQLGFYKEEIRDKVNSYLGKKSVREVRVEGRGFSHEEGEEVQQIDVDLSSKEKKAIAGRISGVGDETIREDLRKLMEMHVSAKKNYGHKQDKPSE